MRERENLNDATWDVDLNVENHLMCCCCCCCCLVLLQIIYLFIGQTGEGDRCPGGDESSLLISSPALMSAAFATAEAA